MSFSEKEIQNATIEAIYWWNRSEYYYHRYFSRINEIRKNTSLFKFFTQKLFENFLKDYSIRRNLAAGYKNVDSLLEKLTKNFFKDAKKGKVGIVDNVSNKIKLSATLSKNEIKSLLSKVAFLINPPVFYPYDSRAKNSLWEIKKEKTQIKKKQLDQYSYFIKQCETLRAEFETDKVFQTANRILNNYKKTDAYNFFKKNQKAFAIRIVDKYLWLKAQKDSRDIDNRAYKKLLDLK